MPVVMFRTPMLCALLGLSGCGQAAAEADPPSAQPEPDRETPSASATRVETAEVRPSSAALQMRLPGEVEGSRDALLAASLGGYVENVHVAEGDEVRNGQVLVRVDAATHSARLQQARIEVESAERELARAQRLRDAISEQQREAAQHRLDAARAAQRTAQVQAGRAVIRAPFAGTVAQLDAERGEVVAPGAPVVRLVQLDPVHISLAVPDRDVTALRVDMPARIRTRAHGTAIEGRVARISPAADLQTRAFEVVVEADNVEGRLLPGMIAQVEIDAEAATTEQIVLPQHVLVTRLENNGVFVVEDGIARWRVVEVANVVRDQVVIESGVRAGDVVVVTGHRELQDGDALLVARHGWCCDGSRVAFDAPLGGAGPEVPSRAQAPSGATAEEATP